VNDGVNDETNDGVNTSLHRKRNNKLTHESKANSRTGEHQSSSERQCSSERMDSSERLNRGGGGWVAARRQYIYTYTAPQKNSVLKGLLPRPGIKSYRNQRGLPLILWKLANQRASIVNPISFHCVP